MDPITAPWSAALGKLEDKRDVTIDTTNTIVAGKIVLGTTAGTNLGKRQSIVGAVEAIRKYYLNRANDSTPADMYFYATPDAAKDGIISESSTEPTGNGLVILAVSATFYSAGSGSDEPNVGGSQFFNETVKQLSDVFLERSAGT